MKMILDARLTCHSSKRQNSETKYQIKILQGIPGASKILWRGLVGPQKERLDQKICSDSLFSIFVLVELLS